ncbi:hypothetical protein ACFY15_31165 [Streptomyces sp. NPDC001373]|uniref:hypothetical protein n=1 Tax=Streptomyces sp. NPDC001373 TaxID=3364565 RepID=UPI0036CD9F22
MCRHTLAMSPDVFLVCFDQRHRVLLLKPSPPAATAWALPSLRRDQGEPCTHAAMRLAVAIAPPGCLRFGAVTARTGRTSHRGRHCTARPIARLFTGYADAARSRLAIPGAVTAWLPHEEAAEAVGHSGTGELAESLALVEAEEYERFDDAYDRIADTLSLVAPSGPVAEFLLHISDDRAWFRWSDEPFEDG